ncbi:hypothetical protein HDU92_003065 [Lobulomyces angularis]|nr:hypothetical protein HDU92_003065 [Lobulomyces angularis]
MGFEGSLNSIITRLPKQRRTGLFSATMTDALNELVRAGLRNPVKILVKVESLNLNKETNNNNFNQRIPQSLKIGYLICSPDEKLTQLIKFLATNKNKKFIVYFSTCFCVDYFFKILSQISFLKDFNCLSLHGKMDPKRREAIYNKFTNASSVVLLCTDVAARGLDIPDVDWVVQFDPPQDPKSFTHRCGRTARIGREGSAVVFLSPKEDTYIEFLKVRKVPLEPLSLIPDNINDENNTIISAKKVTELIKKLNLGDRDIYEKGIKAFVSWVRSYNEHQANYIFQFKEVDIGSVAKGFGLLKLPKMPEVKNHNVQYDAVEFNPDDIKYKDKQREKQRQENLLKNQQKKKESNFKPKSKKTESWSIQTETKEKKLIRKEKKLKKKVAILKAKDEGTFELNEAKKRKLREQEREDLETLLLESKKLKKRKGKNGKEVFSSDEGFSD